MSVSYAFPVVRGIQGGREYFVTMCQLHLVSKIFSLDAETSSPQFRSQRLINKSRIPAISAYIVNNPTTYIFSSIIASIDSCVEFAPLSKDPKYYNVGTLRIPASAKIRINDGQHRKLAIEQAVKKNPSLAHETISVIFFIDWGLNHSQQMFADLNRYAVRPTKSLNVLFDNRDPYSRIVMRVIDVVELFREYTDLEKTDISRSNTKLFTLSSLFFATKELLQEQTSLSFEEKVQLAVGFWSAVADSISIWDALRDKEMSPCELRSSYICAHSVALIALGRVGRALFNAYPVEWRCKLKQISAVDWRRCNPRWVNRIIINGNITNTRKSIVLLANTIKAEVGIDLDEEERVAESSLLKYE